MCNDTATPQLEELVTTVANQLMTVDAATSAEVSQRVLAYLVEQLGVDVSFLRHNDRDRRATRLVAEWPPRLNIPDPDPLRLIYFADADPVFALCEHAKEPLVFRPEPATEDYQRLIEEARGVPVTSAAAVPLVSGEITTGLLGFIKFGDRKWHEAELNALMTIATLFAQVQARVAAEARLRYLADHDDLTGLHNRRALLQHLDQRLAPGQPGPVAALFLDLDRLKAINDYLGHAAGDQFIHVFAQRIGDALVGESLIARLGGDEFVLIPASPMSADAAQPLAERLRDQLKDHVAIGGEVLTRTVSIGVASGTPGQHTPSDLLRRADQAALAAKHAGGDSVAIFTADMSVSGELRNDIELHLRRGIESDALRLVYLPEVDLRTGDIVGTEALVRWQHPTRGLLAPGCFIPVAESINLAGELDRWVLRRACNEFSEWQSAGLGHDALLRINVSAGQLVTGGFVDFVADTIGQHGLDASSVCLEITENVVVQDLHTARATLARLKEVGVHIAIDDFGTGYSAISLLQTLPIDTLKIDKTFVRQLGTNTSDLVIVRGIMTLAEGFQLDVVAEGVETEAAARILLDQRCYRAQGFLFSRPVPGEAMRHMLSARRLPPTCIPATDPALSRWRCRNGNADNPRQASTTAARIHQPRGHHQRRIRTRPAGIDRQLEHAIARQTPWRRGHQHLLVLPQEGRSAQRDDRPRFEQVRVRYPVHRSRRLARNVAQSCPLDAEDVRGQPRTVRSDTDSSGAVPENGAVGRPRDGEGHRQSGDGGPVARRRFRHLLGGFGPRARIGGARSALPQEPVGGQRTIRH